MPKDFERARKRGGKVRTKKLPGGKHMRVVVRPKGEAGPRGGRTIGGEVKKTKGRG